jgi:hypothetical protein
LQAVLEGEFSADIGVQLIEDPGTTGNFEVVILESGELIHSKRTGGKGRAENDKEKALICEAIQAAIDA